MPRLAYAGVQIRPDDVHRLGEIVGALQQQAGRRSTPVIGMVPVANPSSPN